MATQFGTLSPFGLPEFETGIITESVSYSYSQESKALKNKTGDTAGKTFFDEKAELSISGYMPTSTPYATPLASAITLVTAIPDFFIGTVGTRTLVESVTRTNSIEDFNRVEVTASHHPLIV
jgi:hypothetical protein